ncbi:MAG: hypothetical protein IT383_11135 [Deltaproteobacteria bacterium]|nr:hypothetical protein [Deltaproteobacteria bacterium]
MNAPTENVNVNLHPNVTVSARASAANRRIERTLNGVVRGYDALMGKLGLGGRKAPYDDHAYEFVGGARDELRAKHYDKSLRLLWKAEREMPWSTFHDCSAEEQTLMQLADDALNAAERAQMQRIGSAEYKALLDRSYTREEKEAIVQVLSAIGHGEAYAWLVSTEVLMNVKSTGAKAALTMQVLEEAKHFVVLRELLRAFDVPVPRQSVWEYLLLEQVYKARGLEKLFGMNVLVEGIALSLFGMLGDRPGLEVLGLFHLDESRHTALPINYLKEFPLTRWQSRNPLSRVHRLSLVLPTLPLVFLLEEPLARLGIDSFALGGSVLRKVGYLAERAGFDLAIDAHQLASSVNWVFNAYAKRTRAGHVWSDYHLADTTVGSALKEVEREIFAA